MIESSTLGSSTIIGISLLSKAESFSIFCLYSVIVVAPIICRTDFVSIGFRIFEASRDPSADPAPIITCISSMNKIIFLFLLASLVTFFNLSSKSPLYFAPAIS